MLEHLLSTNTTSYSLFIQVHSEGFSLSVFDEYNSLLSARKVNAALFLLSMDDLISLFNNETKLNYENVSITCESDSYTIIPADIFSIENAADFLHFEHKPVENESILFNKIPAFESVNVFSIPATIHKALNFLFPDSTIEHHLSWLLKEKIRLQNEDSLYIWRRINMLDTIVLKNSKIELINSYAYQTPEDFVYFTLNIFDKLSLETEKDSVYLFNADNKPELRNLLSKYVTVIS